MSSIRPVVLGVVRRGEELLVQRVDTPTVDADTYRFLGGGIEFGEYSHEALHREFGEELGVTLTEVSEIGTYEDVFEHRGEPAHEIWWVYQATIEEDWPYERDAFEFHEPELDADLQARWLPRERVYR